MGFLSSVLGGKNNFKAKGVDVLQGATPEQINAQYGLGQGIANQQQQTAEMLAARAGSAAPIDFSAAAPSFGAADDAVARMQAGLPIDYSGANATLGRAGQAISGIQGAGAIDFSGANGSLGSADQVLAQLMATGQGQGPNPALEQLRQATGQNIQQATGLVASQKGVNPALAARTAALAAANANQGAAGQAAILSAQQQLAAQQQSAQVAQGIAAQRASQAQAQAQQGLAAQTQAGQLATTVAGQQAAMAGAQAQQGLAATQQAGALAANLGAQRAAQAQAQAQQQQANTQLLQQQQGAMAGTNLQQQQTLQQALAQYNATRTGQQTAINQVNAGVSAQNADSANKMIGGALGAIGSVAGLAALSDERAKTKIERHEDEAIPGVPRATFEYKGEPGQKYEGVIAQDVERVRPDLVGRTAEGLETVPVELGPVPTGKRSDKDIARDAMEKIGTKKAKGGEVKKSSDKELAAQAMMHRFFGHMVPQHADGAIVADPTKGPASSVGKLMAAFGTGAARGTQQAAAKAPRPASPLNTVANAYTKGAASMGDSRKAYYAFQGANPQASFARGGEPESTHPTFVSSGTPEVVPGRASVPTGVDDESADKVPAWLTPGEGVLPRSVMQAPDAPEKAKDFVEHLIRTRKPTGRAKAAFGGRA